MEDSAMRRIEIRRADEGDTSCDKCHYRDKECLLDADDDLVCTRVDNVIGGSHYFVEVKHE